MSSILPPSHSDASNSGDKPVRVLLQDQSMFGRWGRRIPWIAAIIAIGFALSYRAAYDQYLQKNPRLEERYVSHSETAQQKVAIITIEGTIMHNDGFAKWQIDQVAKDPDVKAVVVRVDSPGGTVTGSDYLYHQLKMLREGEGTGRKIPLVVSMGGIAASGGYYLSMAAGDVPDTIFAERTTWTGSIGVIIPHFTVADLLESWKIQDDSVVSGPYKELGSPTQKLSPEMAKKERAILQAMVDQTFDQFKEIVADARPQLANNKENFATATTGQVFTAKQALELGLVDKLGFEEDAVDRAIELAKLDPRNVRVVKYTLPQGLVNAMLFGPSSSATGPSGQLNLSALIDWATPRCYMLFTWLPPLVSNQAR
ncbi:MAG TPA: signal peptide peptidase SppA [Pirellulales bacterium]|jgi:protease-4|nr:signal peptide peptidase SppA [Pirellulales bacterium]